MARYVTRETEPFGKWKGIPIYLTTILTAVFVVGFVATAFLVVSGEFELLRATRFSVPREGWGNVLSLITYPFFGNQIDFFTPFAIFCFYFWMVGIETHLGRVVLVRLLGLLFVVPALIATLLAFAFKVPGSLFGNFLLSAGLVVAFATLYPNAMAFGFLPFKYVAVACVFCGSLMTVSQVDAGFWRYVMLSGLWGACLAGFLCIRHALNAEYDDQIPLTTKIRSMFRRKPKLRVVPRPVESVGRNWESESVDDGVTARVDEILDKVAKSGLDSLSATERAELEKARQKLQRRDSK